MQIADVIVRKQSDVAVARRKVHDAMLLLTPDVQRAAQFTSEFSDLARALTAGDMRLMVHVSLKRGSAGRRILQLDCVTAWKPAAKIPETHQDAEGWHFVRNAVTTDGWVPQETVDQLREILLLKSREELLSENNELLRKTLSARTESLNRLTHEFGSIQDLDTLLTRVLGEARGVFNCEAGSILMQEDGVLCFRHAANDAANDREKMLVVSGNPVRLPIDRTSMAGAAALDGVVVVRDAYDIPESASFRFNPHIDTMTGFRTRAVISVAMRSSQNELLGVLQLINPRDTDTGAATEFTEDDQKLAVHFAGMAASAIERSSMTRALVLRMMRLAELRDPKETGAHVQRVSQVATRLYVAWATSHGMPEAQMFKQLDQLRPAAILHDVGKVGIADAILKKPGKLEDDEREEMKLHTTIGAATLLGTKTALDDAIRDVVLYHQAKWDGTGYPSREQIVETLTELGIDASKVPEPKGEGIPLFARIVAIADVFDALMSRRAYKEPWDHAKVRDEIERSAGTHFDPELVKLFVADFENYCKIHAAISE